MREALINHVFDLDSPWHILGHLLGKKAIAKNDQRTTSSLLKYVAQHVHVDKVVRLVALLLTSSRRYKLGFQLHKAVVRMLFDAETKEAMKLLSNEWKFTNLHEGVRTLLAEKCVERVASGKSGSWEMSALMDLAKSSSYSPKLKFWLFAPMLNNAPVVSIGTPMGVETDEVLELFRRKCPKPLFIANSREVADQFWSLMEELQASPKLESDENGTIQVLARLRTWSFSFNLYGKVPEEDLAALSKMAAGIVENITEHTTPSHIQQVERDFCARAFGRAVFNLLSKQFPFGCRHSEKEVAAILENSGTAQKYQACVRTLLDAILDMPIRHKIQRHLILESLHILIAEMEDSPAFSALVSKPFAEDLKLLQNDTNRLSSICSSAIHG